MNITLVHAAALGDTLLLIPLLRALGAAFPAARRTLVTRPDFGRLLVSLGHAEAWFSSDDPRHTAWFASPSSPPASPVPWAPADLLISAVSDGADPWAGHARRVLGLATSGPAHPQTPRLLFFHPRPPADYPHHVTRWHTDQLAAQNLVLDPPPAGEPVRGNFEGPIILHPGSGGRAKCWPLSSFVALANALSGKGLRPEFLLGEAERETWPAAAICQLQRSFITHLNISLYDLPALLRTAQLYIGNDAGPTHLAAALTLPTLALFGPTNLAQWRPLGPAVRVVPAAGGNLAALPPGEVLGHALELREKFAKNSGT